MTMQIFGGSSNTGLAKSIAKLGKWESGRTESSQFENGERRIRVEKGSGTAAIIQAFSQPVDEHLIEFCLLCDALSRSG